MNISIPTDVARLLKKKVQSGQYPSEEAAIEAALRRFLADEPDASSATGRTARASGSFLEGEATPRGAFDELIDHEFVAFCEREADDSVTLEEVRAATSKIKDSMARVIIEEERADRF